MLIIKRLLFITVFSFALFFSSYGDNNYLQDRVDESAYKGMVYWV